MAAENESLVAARRIRLAEWVATHFAGVQKAFLDAVPEPQRINQGLLSGLLNGSKSFGEKQASKLEALYQMPPGFLVRAEDPLSQPMIPDEEIMVWAETLVRAKEDAQKAKLPVRARAKELVRAYKLHVESGGVVPPDVAESFVHSGRGKNGAARKARGDRQA